MDTQELYESLMLELESLIRRLIEIKFTNLIEFWSIQYDLLFFQLDLQEKI
jgi:hypothetical protein